MLPKPPFGRITPEYIETLVRELEEELRFRLGKSRRDNVAYIGGDQPVVLIDDEGAQYVLGEDVLPPMAAADHNHTGVYAPVSHNHDGVYAPVSHNHDGVYAPVSHSHDGTYIRQDAGDTGWTTPTLGNGWTPYGAGYAAPAFRKLATGLVVMEGLIRTNGVPSGTAFTLPVGYRPLGRLILSATADTGHMRLDINSTGAVSWTGDPGNWMSICCQFHAAPLV